MVCACAVQIQVAHFETDVIQFTGTASHPRLSMNVPRPITDASDPDKYGELRDAASQRLAMRKLMDTPHFTYVCEIFLFTKTSKFLQDSNQTSYSCTQLYLLHIYSFMKLLTEVISCIDELSFFFM